MANNPRPMSEICVDCGMELENGHHRMTCTACGLSSLDDRRHLWHLYAKEIVCTPCWLTLSSNATSN